jgi:hypothetical protein
MSTHGGVEVFLSSELDGEWSVSFSGHLTPGEGGLGWSPEQMEKWRFWTEKNNDGRKDIKEEWKVKWEERMKER